MNLIKLFKTIIITLSFIISKEVIPIDITGKEILSIHSKDRDYYNLFQNKVIYSVEGPCILNIYSRLAFPEHSKRINPYDFNLIIKGENFKDSLTINNFLRKDSNTFSRKHPKHSYTLSAKDVINIPKGKHQIELNTNDSNSKVLVRLISNHFKLKKNIEQVSVNENLSQKILKNHKDKNIQFHLLKTIDNKNKLSFTLEGSGTVFIDTRLVAPEETGRDYYQYKIRKNEKLFGTYHMFAQKSSKWGLIMADNISGSAVSVNRKTNFGIGNDIYDIEIELITSSNKDVLFRLGYKLDK